MKRFKILVLCLVVTMLTSLFAPISVFASPCCYLEIETITQNHGMITVDYWALNPLNNRELKITVSSIDGYMRYSAYEDIIYIDADSYEPYTFDGSFLIEGCNYELTISYTYCCSNYYCSLESDSMEFTAECGIPLFDYVDIPDGVLTLLGQSKVAVRFTANTAGLYKFALENEWDYDIRTYPQNNYARPGTSYCLENQSNIYIISATDGNDLSLKLNYEKVIITDVASKNDNPADNDICFEISKHNGINAITIKKAGLYSFELQDKYAYNSYELIGEMGDRIAEGSVDYQLKEVLKPGLYYLDTSNLTEEYNLTIRYIVPEELELDHAYYPEYTEQRVGYYYRLKIDKPTVLTISNLGQIPCKIYLKDYAQYYYGEEKEILTSGEYYVYFVNDVSEGIEIRFTEKEFESACLDIAFTPEFSPNNYYYYFAFCAPADGKYEFDFTKLNSNYWIDNDMQNSPGLKCYVREMKKDEWVLVGVYEQGEITIREYAEAVATELTFDESAYYTFVSGKTYLYSFTPDKDDLYKIYTENTYCSNIKVWTDEEVYYETGENYTYSFNMNFEFKKNVPVYISFSGYGDSYGNQSSVVVKSPYDEIGTSATVYVETESEVMVYYTATESGYHNFNLSRGYGSYTTVSFTIKGETDYISYNSSISKLIYLEKGEKLFITFGKFNDNWLPAVNITVTPIVVEELVPNVAYSAGSDAYYRFNPESDGIYKITRPNGYRLEVQSGKSYYLAYGVENDVYFVGKAGNSYLVRCMDALYNADSIYTDITLSKADYTSVDTDVWNNAGSGFEIFAFNAAESGMYRIENKAYNTTLSVFNNDEWPVASNSASSLFRLEKGLNCIISEPIYTEYDGIDHASSSFCIKKATDSQTTGISIENGFISPEDDGLVTLRLCITAPYDVRDLNIGIEYQSEIGETIQRNVGYESMYFYDVCYTELDIYGMNWKVGETYGIKPYIFSDDNENDKIYGEEKEITFELRSDIMPLRYATTKTPLKARSQYSRNGRDYYFEFIQPEDAETYTYINLSKSFNYYFVYNENFEYVSSQRDAYGNMGYKLEPGQKYYISAFSRYYDSDAEVSVSSLADVTTSETDAISNAEVAGNAVHFVVSNNEAENESVYAVAYGSDGVVTGIVKIDAPQGAYSFAVGDGTDVSEYKLIFMGANLAPICNATTIISD